jgi:hypothetical protein
MATAAIAAIVAVHSKLPMGLAVVAVAATEAVVMAAVIATVVVAVAAITISAMRNMQPMDLAGSVKAIATVAAIVVAITEAAAAVAVAAIAIAIFAVRNKQPMDLAGSVEAIAVAATEAIAITAVVTAATVAADSTRRSSIVDWWEFHWSGDPSGEPLRDPHHGDQQPGAHCGAPSDVHGPHPATKAQQLPHGAHMTRRGLQLQDRHK